MKALLDLGLLVNFISRDATLWARLKPSLKKDPYLLYVANRERILHKLLIKYKVIIKLNI
jgi:hypothetical protein